MTNKESDKRPRIYQSASTKHGKIELTVQGAEGETAEEIETIASEALNDLLVAQQSIEKEDYDGRETQ